MWHLKKLIVLGLLLSTGFYAYAQGEKQSTQNERYKLYIIENLRTSEHTKNDIPVATSGYKNNYILIDTVTGKTWILTNIGAPFTGDDGEEKVLESFAWEPLFFKSAATEKTPVWDKSWGKGGLSTTPK